MYAVISIFIRYSFSNFKYQGAKVISPKRRIIPVGTF
nr:MAG TPA: hypothetical protein [Caudoviricetes sp.]